MLKKRYLKRGKICKVTFNTHKRLAAETVNLVGDFNNWDENATPMNARKDGRFTVWLHLPANQEFQFRYLVNGDEWHNDWEADSYVPNQHGSDNCVVKT